MQILNPTNRHDQQIAIQQARVFAPGMVENYQGLIQEHGFPAVLARALKSDMEAADYFLMLATLLGALNEMTEAN